MAPRSVRTVAVTALIAGAVVVIGARSDATPLDATVHEIGTGTSAPAASAIADVTQDGFNDVGVAERSTNTIALYVNGLNGGSWTRQVVDTTPQYPTSVATGDIDSDFDLDIAVASFNDDTIQWYENVDGAGTTWTKHVIATDADGAFAVSIGDLDNDGDVDLASASFYDGHITWYRNDLGDASSWTPSLAGTMPSARSMVMADLDGDGLLDLAAVGINSATVAWFRNEGLGVPWTETIVDSTRGRPAAIAAGDLDGDGDADLAAVSNNTRTVDWFRNDAGNGSAWTTTTLTTGANPICVSVADLDNDGDLDIVFGSQSVLHPIHWLENTAGDATAWTDDELATGDRDAQFVTVGDLNGGGFPEINFGQNGDSRVRWLTTGARVGPATTTTTDPLAAPAPHDEERQAGEDRYDTAAQLNADLAPGVPIAYIATGETFADALAVGPIAGEQGGALLLVRHGSIPQSTIDQLVRLNPARIVVVGGTGAISSVVATDLAQYTPGTVTRVAGTDRFATAVALSTSAFPTTTSTVHLAAGLSYPDGVAAGPSAGYEAGPTLLVNGATLSRAATDELTRLHPSTVVLAGGTGAIPEAVATRVAALLPDAAVIRRAGADRYATSAALADAIVDANTGTIYAASGATFADALSATPAAVRARAPIVLVPHDGALPASVRALVRRAPGALIVIVGGSAAISDDMAAQLRA